MANERSKEQSSNVPSRAAAHQPPSSGLSHPAVQHPLKEPEIPIAITPEARPTAEIKPFQLKPANTVVQRVEGNKRKRRTAKKKKDPPRKKQKSTHKSTENTGKRQEEEEEQTLPATSVSAMEEELEPPPDDPLKFVAWNANHFGKGNNLSEDEITGKILDFDPQDIIDQVREWDDHHEGYSVVEVESYLQVLAVASDKLPAFSDISKVDELMDAVKALNYIFKKLGEEGDTFLAGKQKFLPVLVGALKKHYMMAHARHLMEVHPNLIMGFNEVGEGVEFMKKTLEENADVEEEEDGQQQIKGSSLKKGPKLQAISIDVVSLNATIKQYNRRHRDVLDTVEKKDQYTDSDYKAQKNAFEALGSPAGLLGRSQIEYYPVAFNEEKYEYLGCMALSSAGAQRKDTEINWTKNPYLSYMLFRPIVVHKLKRKNSKGKPAGKEIWYGMVHTSPEGDEFDRRDIFREQLETSLPKLRSLARKARAQLIVGGDYYIAEEALVRTPPVLRVKNRRYKSEVEDPYELTRKEIREKKLGSNKSIGQSENDKNLSTGTMNEVRNLQHPESDLPFNYQKNLERKHLQDARSLTGTNKNTTGLQSADYFIVDRRSSLTYRAGVIDPATGLPHHMESEDNELSESWFSFSDHVPVMLVVSDKENDEAVDNAFPSSRSYFHNEEHNVNPFDLRFLQVSNILAHILSDRKAYDPEVIGNVEKALAAITKKRQSGAYTEEDIKWLNNIKMEAEKLLKQSDGEQPVSIKMFETSQASSAFITTILQQVWSDILEMQLDKEEEDLLNYIQQVRMIIKEEKINAAFSVGLNEKDEKDRSEVAKETREILERRLGKGSLATIDRLHTGIKASRQKEQVNGFVAEKRDLQRRLLNDLMMRIGTYVFEVEDDPLFKDRKEYANVSQNYNLLGDIIGRKVVKSKLHDDQQKVDIEESKDNPYKRHASSEDAAEKGGIPNTGTDCFMNALCQLLSLPTYQHLAVDGRVRQLVGKVGNQQTITKIDVRDLRLYLFELGLIDSMGHHEDAAELMGKLMDELDPVQLLNQPQLLQQHAALFKYVAVDKRKILESHDVSAQHASPNDPSAVPWVGGEKETPQPPENMLNIPVTDAQGLIDWLNIPKVSEHRPVANDRKTIDWALMDEGWRSVTKKEEQTIFSRLPAVLTIALKRFDNNMNKVSNTFKMPQAFELYEQGPLQTQLKRYELKGFIYHQGQSLRGGHYWAHKKDQYGNWLKANDASVGASDMQGTTEGAFKHDLDNAYVYTYELVNSALVQAPDKARSLDVEQDDNAGQVVNMEEGEFLS